MKIWHDDIRKPPDDSWVWCRTNEDAFQYILECFNDIEEVSLDHDLGLHYIDVDKVQTQDPDLLKGGSEETGVELVKWLCEENLIPPKITIHSWNPVGAESMAQLFRDKGHDPIVEPFDLDCRK